MNVFIAFLLMCATFSLSISIYGLHQAITAKETLQSKCYKDGKLIDKRTNISEFSVQSVDTKDEIEYDKCVITDMRVK